MFYLDKLSKSFISPPSAKCSWESQSAHGHVSWMVLTHLQLPWNLNPVFPYFFSLALHPPPLPNLLKEIYWHSMPFKKPMCMPYCLSLESPNLLSVNTALSSFRCREKGCLPDSVTYFVSLDRISPACAQNFHVFTKNCFH